MGPRNRFRGLDSASLCSLAKSIPYNRFLDSLNVYKFSAGLLEQYMGARNRVGISLSYRLVRLLSSLAESIPWNRFLGSLKVCKYHLGLRFTLGNNDKGRHLGSAPSSSFSNNCSPWAWVPWPPVFSPSSPDPSSNIRSLKYFKA